MQHFLSDDNRMSNNTKDTHPQIPFSSVRGKKSFPTGASKFLSQMTTTVNVGWFASRDVIPDYVATGGIIQPAAPRIVDPWTLTDLSKPQNIGLYWNYFLFPASKSLSGAWYTVTGKGIFNNNI